MRQWRCLSCRGEYDAVQADGTLYFHACPPLSADPDGPVVERPDRRDENLVFGEPGEKPRAKAEGRGRERIVPVPPPPPEPPRGRLERAVEFVRRRLSL